MQKDIWVGFVRKDEKAFSKEEDLSNIRQLGLESTKSEISQANNVLFLLITDTESYNDLKKRPEFREQYFTDFVSKKGFDKMFSNIPEVIDGVLDITQMDFNGRIPNNKYSKGNLLLGIAIKSKTAEIKHVEFPEELQDLKRKVHFYGVNSKPVTMRRNSENNIPFGFPRDNEYSGPSNRDTGDAVRRADPILQKTITPDKSFTPLVEYPDSMPPAEKYPTVEQTQPTDTSFAPTQDPRRALGIDERNEEIVTLDDDDFPTNAFITNFFMMSNVDLDNVAGYYDEDAQFSMTISPFYDDKNTSLGEYIQFTRNLCIADTNLLIGRDAVEGLKMIAAHERMFSITSVLNSKIIEGFYSVVVSGVMTLKSRKSAYFDRTMTIVDNGSEYVIASDQIHISQRPVN